MSGARRARPSASGSSTRKKRSGAARCSPSPSTDLALEAAVRVREIAERLQLEDPGNAYWPRKLAWSHSEIGMLSYMQGEFERALESENDARAAFRALTLADPTRVE